jgi:hypothetical protein
MSEQLKWEREKGIFGSFLATAPGFAGADIVHWEHNGNESPDILCVDRLGRTIGVELTEWMDEHQIGDFAGWEKLLSSAKIPGDWTVHLDLFPFGRRSKSKERRVIVEELSRVIAEETSRQVKKSGVLSFTVSLFDLRSRAPTVSKYCNSILGLNPGSGRIHLAGSGSFSSAAPELALQTVIEKKIHEKPYSELRKALVLEFLYLIVFYDLGIIKNTPNLDVDVTEVAASVISKMPMPFDELFVLMFPGGDASTGRTVYRVGTEAHTSLV